MLKTAQSPDASVYRSTAVVAPPIRATSWLREASMIVSGSAAAALAELEPPPPQPLRARVNAEAAPASTVRRVGFQVSTAVRSFCMTGSLSDVDVTMGVATSITTFRNYPQGGAVRLASDQLPT
ncbi:MAG: hypothetical protein KGL68_13655 [Burkholderiales bacterium]|nr:hypothetical protein [Burkholderiales bacterium]